MVAENGNAEKRKRNRSPSYPGIGLEEALDLELASGHDGCENCVRMRDGKSSHTTIRFL